jgi:hypothetical protein
MSRDRFALLPGWRLALIFYKGLVGVRQIYIIGDISTIDLIVVYILVRLSFKVFPEI